MAVTLSMSITQNSQSIENNTSNITVSVYAKWTGGSHNTTGECTGSITIDGTKYSFSGKTFNDNKTTSGQKTVMSKTVNIKHEDDGTKTMWASASFVTGVSSGTIACSDIVELDTIPRKSSLSVANGTLGSAQTLTVARQATSFTHTITATCGTASATVATKSTSTSISFTPPLEWAKQNTTGTSVSVTYKITTYNGSTSVGDNSYTKTCTIPASVKPKCSLTVTDAMGYADTYGGYIKGLSKFKVVVSATTSYGSAIASYKTTANGSTYTSSSFTTGVLLSNGTLSVSATVTDKRGRTGTATNNLLTVLDYAAPKITALSVRRCKADGTANDQGEYVEVRFSGSATSLSNKNTAVYTLEYKKSSENAYTEVALPSLNNAFAVSDASYIFAAETGSSYDVRVTVADNFGNGYKTTSASTAFTLMHWLANGLGMAIGKVAEWVGVFDIGFKTRFSGGIMHPTLEPETDLDDVRTPNTYVGADVSRNNYGNCPLTSGTFTLEVVGMGEEGQVKQRLTYCHKTAARAWERIYHSSAWGEWVCVSDFGGKLLASPGLYMTAGHTADLAEPVSKQRSGIVLVFSKYTDGAAKNEQFSSFFVPKYLVSNHPGCGHDFKLGGVFNAAAKYLYIHDAKIVGNDKNHNTVTVGGITYTNSDFVLRYVIGV